MKLALLALLVLPLIAQATQCIPKPHCFSIGPTSIFFVGKVIELHETGQTQFTGDAGPPPKIYEMRLRVEEAFFGPKHGDIVTILTTYPSVPGAKQFIEAHLESDGKIRTNICPDMDTSGEPMLHFLRRGRQGRGDGTSLTVYNGDESRKSVGATVTIKGPVERTTSVEEIGGGFRFKSIPPGHYVIHASRAGYLMDDIALDIVPNACGLAVFYPKRVGESQAR
jgi:hypothetical protein